MSAHSYSVPMCNAARLEGNNGLEVLGYGGVFSRMWIGLKFWGNSQGSHEGEVKLGGFTGIMQDLKVLQTDSVTKSKGLSVIS